jgi:hypothetical protein
MTCIGLFQGVALRAVREGCDARAGFVEGSVERTGGVGMQEGAFDLIVAVVSVVYGSLLERLCLRGLGQVVVLRWLMLILMNDILRCTHMLRRMAAVASSSLVSHDGMNARVM